MDFADVARASNDVARLSGRLDKIGRLADLLRRLAEPEIEPVIAFLSGEARQGRLGVGHATIRAAFAAVPDVESRPAHLSIQEADDTFATISSLAGAGSGKAKLDALADLVRRTAGTEREFLRRLLYGELRQGALEGVLAEAVAKAAGLAAADVRRAAMTAGSLGAASRAALTGGKAALDAFRMQVMRPINPMLADSAGDVAEALASIDEAVLEYKLDGARIQAHKSGDDVRLFSRALNDVTASAPEIIDIVRALPVREAIFDGEVLALKADGTPFPFQDTMRRFGRKRAAAGQPDDSLLTPFLFDCLYVDGTPLIDEPQERRVTALHELAGRISVPSLLRPSRERAEGFAREALARGHEGVMVKALGAPYAAGRRGSAWLKVKQARTLDLVVLAVEWGSGRRQGYLSNIHLGARDPSTNSFVMLGKTFKGMTDAMLAWQTEHFRSIEIGRDAYTVHVRPETVVEIAFNEVQRSPIYPGGVALRFARVKRYRSDKKAEEADTIEAVRALAPL